MTERERETLQRQTPALQVMITNVKNNRIHSENTFIFTLAQLK